MPRHAPHRRRRPRHAFAGLLLAAAVLAAGPAALAAQALYVVDETGDTEDANTADGACATTAGTCTLRAAIAQANATPGLVEIHFAIDGAGPHTIALKFALPDITGPVTIDGYTQDGASPNTNGPYESGNAVRPIVVDGTILGAAALTLAGDASTVRGLRLLGGSSQTILLDGSGGHRIEGNEIRGNGGYGIFVASPDNLIGSAEPADRNVINGRIAVHITPPDATGTVIRGNLIGTDVAGTGMVGTPFIGVEALAPGTTIGGAEAGAGNVISGNIYGIVINHESTGPTVVQGNRIGTDVTGTVSLPNSLYGITVERASGHVIGGTTAAARNVISGNGDVGIVVLGDASDVRIQGNYVGVDIHGTAAMSNGAQGIYMGGGGTVGGTEPGAGNVISGNGQGLYVIGQGISVQGNLIGTDASGSAPIPNRMGLYVINASLILIGGMEDGAGNVIAANDEQGVVLEGNGTNVVVAGNFIGTDVTGTAELGNGISTSASGVVVAFSGGAGNVIEGNVIVHSGGHGITVSGGTGTRLTRNAIHDNGGLGIEIGPDGVVTPNDPGDGDAGPNNQQNFPVVSLAWLDGGTVVEGTLNSAAGTDFTLEFFASATCDPSEHGEAAAFLGSAAVTTDGAGNAAFVETLATPAEAGQVVAATATDPFGNTSELSTCVRVNDEPTYVVTTTEDVTDGFCSAGHCTLREAIAAANAHAGTDRIHFDIPGDGPRQITLDGSLPELMDAVVIDGYTQPGASANTNAPDEGTNARILIEINADNTSGVGLHLTGGGATVRGLAIHSAGDRAVWVASDGNVLEGNFLGTDATGKQVPAEFGFGVQIQSGADNRIGGTTPAARNLISGAVRGVGIDPEATGTVVQGNLIGTDAGGAALLPNVNAGIHVQGVGSVIGGADDGAGNVIAGSAIGVEINGVGTVLRGNRIGTDPSGTSALGNEIGVALGSASAPRVVSSNRIGTRLSTATGPGEVGVALATATGTVIGGVEAGAGNVVSGNTSIGILLKGAAEAIIQGNAVGTDAGGTADLGNGSHGIYLQDASYNVIGGVEDGSGNTIAFNGGGGVVVLSGTPNAIARNLIHGNVGPGIDLGDDGITANDAGDADEGPNDLANFPELSAALLGSAVIEGTMTGVASGDYRLEFFASDACDASGHGQGQRFLGFSTVTTDGTGSADFTASLDGTATPGHAITATALHPTGNTSEFSACVTGVGYQVAVEATEGTIARGRDATYEVTVTTLGGTFDRDVTLSCGSLPDGASCAFTPAVVRPGDGEATATLVLSTSDPDTPTGAREFTVVAAYDAIQRSAAAEVTVTDFTIAAAPEQVTVTGGNDAVFTVTVAPDGPSFGEPVTLACSDLPAGAACSFSPAVVTPGTSSATSTLTLSTAPLESSAAPAYRGGQPFRRGGPASPRAMLLTLACILLTGALLMGARGRPRRVRLAIGALLFVALADIACDGDPTGPPDPPDPVTTTFTISGTSGELVRSAPATVRVE